MYLTQDSMTLGTMAQPSKVGSLRYRHRKKQRPIEWELIPTNCLQSKPRSWHLMQTIGKQKGLRHCLLPCFHDLKAFRLQRVNRQGKNTRSAIHRDTLIWRGSPSLPMPGETLLYRLDLVGSGWWLQAMKQQIINWHQLRPPTSWYEFVWSLTPGTPEPFQLVLVDANPLKKAIYMYAFFALVLTVFDTSNILGKLW